MRTISSKSAITKMQAIIIAVIVVVAAVAAGYYVAFRPSSQTGTSTYLRIGWGGYTICDPGVGTDFSSSAAEINLYDPLVYPTTTGDVKPWVAENWTSSPDGLSWTFNIKQGIKFHTGRELTAEDVAFSMRRLVTIGEGYGYIFSPYYDSAIAIANYTVQVNLTKPFGPFLIALVRLFIVDHEEVMAHLKFPGSYGDFGDYGREWLLTHDAGSGPLEVKNIVLGGDYTFEKYSAYWGTTKSNSPDIVVYYTANDPTLEKTQMLQGQLDISFGWLDEEWYASMATNSGINITTVPGDSPLYYMMNTQKPPLDDIHVRKALAYAFDYQTVASTIMKNRGPVSDGPVPSTLPGWTNVFQYTLNYSAAREELKLSKYYPDIINNPDNYAITIHWPSDATFEEKIALSFAQGLQEIGLKAQLTATPWNSIVQETASVDTAPHIESVSVAASYSEAGSILESKYSSNSAGTWEQNEWLKNATLDAQMKDAVSTLNRTERFAKYAAIQSYIVGLCPTIFTFEMNTKHAYQTYVDWPIAHGVHIPGMGYDFDVRNIGILPH
ncbi:MAG: ABC transporter substrate-binding protein [Candidatus Bathyarchaeia archaeon]